VKQKNGVMNYGETQHYKDELDSWKRVLAFHKQELREALSQVGMLDGQEISVANKSELGTLTDKLMVQEQHLDYMTNEIISQAVRVENLERFADKSTYVPVSQRQDLLRGRMKLTEYNFLRTKYSFANCIRETIGHRPRHPKALTRSRKGVRRV
jgi:hypothetical protein